MIYIEELAVWCSIISICASVVSIVAIFLVRNNIVNILEKDVVLFDQNFEIKKEAISNALSMIDEVMEYGKQITLKPEFEKKAKQCYNNLLCVITNVTIADEFYNIAIDKNIEVTNVRLANFKLLCRNDIGFKTRKAKTVKRIIEQENNSTNVNETMLKTSVVAGSTENISASTNATAGLPKENVQPQQIQRPMAPAQARPVSQQQAQPKPVAPAPVKKPGRPKKS